MHCNKITSLTLLAYESRLCNAYFFPKPWYSLRPEVSKLYFVVRLPLKHIFFLVAEPRFRGSQSIHINQDADKL